MQKKIYFIYILPFFLCYFLYFYILPYYLKLTFWHALKILCNRSTEITHIHGTTYRTHWVVLKVKSVCWLEDSYRKCVEVLAIENGRKQAIQQHNVSYNRNDFLIKFSVFCRLIPLTKPDQIYWKMYVVGKQGNQFILRYPLSLPFHFLKIFSFYFFFSLLKPWRRYNEKLQVVFSLLLLL